MCLGKFRCNGVTFCFSIFEVLHNWKSDKAELLFNLKCIVYTAVCNTVTASQSDTSDLAMCLTWGLEQGYVCISTGIRCLHILITTRRTVEE